ncbi:MAG TPA: UvrD-helicase domain-containing protein, partial [Lysobacter sp.]|nr:UvrD-helicase domain-containing protein [Lysobacter sp.]
MSATVFDTPLDERSLIEASAGTGKTYALAGLFARAVIVHRLAVPQILAVTYTVAATQELHERVRLRLHRASQLMAQWPRDDAGDGDASGDDAETALLRQLLRTALQDESVVALRLRLLRAVRDLDLAAITTIHGFCQRLLGEHALLAGQPLLATDIEPGNRAQRHRLAVKAWREGTRTVDGADFLARTFGSLDTLAEDIRHLLAPEPLLPPAPGFDACGQRADAWRHLRRIFVAEGEASREALRQAVARRILSGAKDKTVPVEALWAWFGAQSEAPPRPHEELWRLTRDALRNICLKNMESLVPDLALCGAVETFLVADEACDLQNLHALRAGVRAQDAREKRDAHVRDFDDLVEEVFRATRDPVTGPALATALRAQFPLVLVDEFQDTDARQWAIFESLFGEGGLLLVGDPKQAIYRFRGGDVDTYLAARATARIAAPLDRNFRSRPSVLSAVNALFEAATHADPSLLGDGIGFTGTAPGGRARDDDYAVDGTVAPAIVVQSVPPNPNVKKGTYNKDESIAIAARCCAIEIRDRLRAARAGHARRRDGDAMRALEPRDFAVLVRTHDEGIAIRDALAHLGIPAVSAGRGSLYDTDEAQQLLALLLALAAPGDDRRLRAVLATPLFGYDAQSLQDLEDDGEAQRRWQQGLADWRLRWETHGPQPMLAEVLAREAQRLLRYSGGERQLTHLSQLAEQLQEARAHRLGPQAQLDWLRSAIAHADRDDENQQPRLESDASRVQILTLHRSKGLEFPLVFLPFAAIGRGGGKSPRFIGYHLDDGLRVRQWRTEQTHAGAPAWDDAIAAARAEDQAEDMRLAYVGLTRARDALWVCSGPFASHEQSALFRLFGGVLPRPAVRLGLGGALVVREGLPDPGDTARLAPGAPEHVPEPRIAHRRLRRDWWIHSFSQLHRQHAHGAQALADEAPADD